MRELLSCRNSQSKLKGRQFADLTVLMAHLDDIHTTPLGVERIKKNLKLTTEDVVAYCKAMVKAPESRIERRGKNWYVQNGCCQLTINAYSYTQHIL